VTVWIVGVQGLLQWGEGHNVSSILGSMMQQF